MSLASSKAITWQQQYFNPPVYYYPTKSHRHTLINGYESRSTNHEAFLVRFTLIHFFLFTACGGINGLIAPFASIRLV
uniref:Uncharacterized protein n=1 Tax=Plectus sambesii TaxID=2011161 RepID=A0A914VSA7_9BILA